MKTFTISPNKWYK